MKFEMIKAAKKLVEFQMGVKPNENVLIITDTDMPFSIAEAMAGAAYAVGAETMIMIISPGEMHHKEPPKPVAEAMKASDVMLVVTSKGITHTKAKFDACAAGARLSVMHAITEDIMIHYGKTFDYEKVNELADKVGKALKDADKIRVVSDAGTDITMSIKGRGSGRGIVSFPGGEAPVAPVEGTAEGTIVIDYLMEEPIGFLKEPITMKVKKGRVVDIQGGEQAIRFREIVESHDKNATNIAEVAIGLNDGCRLIPFMRESKKKLGTVHIGLGTNFDIGGITKSDMHTDMLIAYPTVYLDGKKIIERQKLLI